MTDCNYAVITEPCLDYYSFGITGIADDMSIFHARTASHSERCFLVLFERNTEKPLCFIEFPKESRIGDVWGMNVHLPSELSDKELEYVFSDNEKMFSDPYGRAFSGRDTWGRTEQYGNLCRSPLKVKKYDWQGDKTLNIPYEQCIFYLLHVRGFTMSRTCPVDHHGTFEGLTQMIPYIKSLGVTTVEIMPCQEFEEIIPEKKGITDPVDTGIQRQTETKNIEITGIYEKTDGKRQKKGRINYWGYTKPYAFAPKASLCRKKDRNPVNEFKDMVKAMHAAGLELVVQMFFDGSESAVLILDILRFWVCEYHIDGIHLIGNIPAGQIASDSYLKRTKLIADSWADCERGDIKHLAESTLQFQHDMRRFLKGDEGMIKSLVFHTHNNPEHAAVINYMAGVDGFTMRDMVSFDRKHNDANGENNSDGTDFNYSWNCGAEGSSKKKKIEELRIRQTKNALLLLFLSQGTPLLLAGDEFARSQKGNNNAYCQDNAVSFVDWKFTKKYEKLLEFVRHVIHFRMEHPVFRYPIQPTILDTLACGKPDISYHGVNTWQPEFENWRRQLGILYCGDYATKEDNTNDQTFYVLYNMHWEEHEFALPTPEKNNEWFLAMDTTDTEHNGFYKQSEEPRIKDQKKLQVPARAILVLVCRQSEIPKKGKNKGK